MDVLSKYTQSALQEAAWVKIESVHKVRYLRYTRPQNGHLHQ